ncbi:pimeloyl-ACP methyl ester carboxylesterase [Planomicrobium soli]|uniref:Pimeloyl-ACP methyl ester carboxylesterase n=1 Tax=Planomicrobium soli TaxID=1176648 RepID=A0A2P8H3W0_9BACL|nr:alpha/beta hydrolase [Planomicrobium soli]PSL40906.1 pimeloyl-ACP methyl ester carboxylesterase [Planomicrobium soli]
MKTKKISRSLRVLRNALLAMVTVFVMWAVASNVTTAYEQKKYPATGQLVEVDGNHMHIYTKGNGENTVILLSGLGTAAPVLDFEPLLNEMSKKNKVVVVELFGYGWSDRTEKERTVENITEEIRIALQKANIEGPYILMPHSISGIYSMYYANKYPEEIKAIIGIDPTLPKQFDYRGDSAPTLPNLIGLAAPTGITRLISSLSPDIFLPSAADATYSEENMKMLKTLFAWNGYNKNVIAETNEIQYTVDKMIDMTFPSDLPVMIFTPEENKVIDEDGKSKVIYYQAQLSHGSSNKLVTLDGGHYLHWTRYKEMSQYVNEFVEAHQRLPLPN